MHPREKNWKMVTFFSPPSIAGQCPYNKYRAQAPYKLVVIYYYFINILVLFCFRRGKL